MMPLFELPLHILLCASIIFGIYAACQPGMLVDKAMLWAFDIDIWVSDGLLLKPLYQCPICMSSLWGILYSIFMQLSGIGDGWTILHLPALILGVAGLNYILIRTKDE